MNKPRTVETPTALLHSAMNSSAKLSQRARRILERQLREIERELKTPGLQPGRRLELMDALVTTMTALDKSTTEAAKLLRGQPPIAADTASAADVLEELRTGTKSHAADRR